ncbi:MAG: hypothetical protein K5979_12370 [Ruminococcus sp.]|nr:hypothetical protein [Ruminococcus sp.]
MKNDKKKTGFSPTKKIFSAAAMLAVSASMLATSTYAWFSMNTQVTAKGMQVKAKAEGGIVISNDAATPNWVQEADASYTTKAELFPISTADFSTWYHAKSTQADDAAAGQAASAYTQPVTTNPTGSGIGTDATSNAYYLVDTFKIASSGETLNKAGEAPLLYINQVTATNPSDQDLSKALRVGITVGSDTTKYIYAPLGGTASYKVGGSDSSTTPLTPVTGKNKATSISSIPSTSGTPITVKVYVWYEGEDQNLKSSNASGVSLDDLSISVQFGTTPIS